MGRTSTVSWVKAHKWWVALTIVIFFGYSLGKDIALRDNKADAAQSAGTM